jgi:hypothetical protein
MTGWTWNNLPDNADWTLLTYATQTAAAYRERCTCAGIPLPPLPAVGDDGFSSWGLVNTIRNGIASMVGVPSGVSLVWLDRTKAGWDMKPAFDFLIWQTLCNQANLPGGYSQRWTQTDGTIFTLGSNTSPTTNPKYDGKPEICGAWVWNDLQALLNVLTLAYKVIQWGSNGSSRGAQTYFGGSFGAPQGVGITIDQAIAAMPAAWAAAPWVTGASAPCGAFGGGEYQQTKIPPWSFMYLSTSRGCGAPSIPDGLRKAAVWYYQAAPLGVWSTEGDPVIAPDGNWHQFGAETCQNQGTPWPPRNGAQPVAAAGWPNYTASGWYVAQAAASADYAVSGGFTYQ